MNPWLYATVGLPTLLQGYLLGLLTLAFGIIRRPRFDGPMLVGDWRPWVERRWDYCTTIAAWQGRPEWFRDRTRYHELVHFRQYIAHNALGACLAAALAPALGWWAFAVWGSSGALWLVPNILIGIIRYKRPGVPWIKAAYFYTAHEQHAFAMTETRFDGKADRWELPPGV